MFFKSSVIILIAVSAIGMIFVFWLKKNEVEELALQNEVKVSLIAQDLNLEPSSLASHLPPAVSLDPMPEKIEELSSMPTLEEIVAVNAEGNDAIKAFVSSLLKKSEQEGLEFLAELEAELDYEAIGQAIYDHFILDGRYLDGLAAFGTLDRNVTLVSPLLHSFVSEYYRNEPQAALVWVAENSNLNGIEVAAYSLGELSAGIQEPAGEIHSMLNAELPLEIRTCYLNGAMESWMEEDLDEAFEFFSTADLPGFYYDETIYLMAGKAAGVDPLGAMAWAETIINEQLRYSALSEVSSSWISMAPTEFQQWLGEQSPKIQAEIEKVRRDLE